jgi:hypothetical protein
VIEDAKLLDYALNLEHEVGRGKALFFNSIGYSRDDYEELKLAFLEALPYVEGRFVKKKPHDADNSDKTARVCTLWEIREGRATRLITVSPAAQKSG